MPGPDAAARPPGEVVVMDNLAVRKVKGVESAIDAVGASVGYRPPYSPDLNPIEKLWSKSRAWLRRAAARDLDGLVHQIAQVLHDADASECRNYLASGGYRQK